MVGVEGEGEREMRVYEGDLSRLMMVLIAICQHSAAKVEYKINKRLVMLTRVPHIFYIVYMTRT